MKLVLYCTIALFSFGAKDCKKAKATSACYKGRLETKGICGNYTIKLLEGNLDASKMEASWKDEVTGKTHTNVFGLQSTCTFPERLKEGDAFYFTLADSNQECNVCMAYYPAPQKKLSIAVLDGPCN